jgi:lipoprotein-releasing system permease protein
MTPNFRIALRFLTAKKRSMLMSLSCIVLGVGLFVVTQATTSGFQGYFIKTILGTDGALRIEDKRQATLQTIAAGGYNSGFEIENQGFKYISGIDYPEQLKKTLETFTNVTGISEVLRGSNIIIRSSFKDDNVQVYGINIRDHLQVSDLGSQIVGGSLIEFEEDSAGALLGREMADRLHLGVRDTFELVSGDQTRRMKVSGIYETGVEDIDRVRVYVKMGDARSLLKKPGTAISYLQVNLKDKDQAERDAPWMSEILDHSVAPWQVREKTWLQVFKMLRISTAITVSVFTLIAGLAMFNTLAMIVLEKTKDIAILRSMGYTRRDISLIFLWQATIVLAIGASIGCVVGAAVTLGVSQVPLQIRGIFATNKLIVVWDKWHYLEAVSTAMVTVMVASLVPARRAARLEPGDIIRGTAT